MIKNTLVFLGFLLLFPLNVLGATSINQAPTTGPSIGTWTNGSYTLGVDGSYGNCNNSSPACGANNWTWGAIPSLQIPTDAVVTSLTIQVVYKNISATLGIAPYDSSGNIKCMNGTTTHAMPNHATLTADQITVTNTGTGDLKCNGWLTPSVLNAGTLKVGGNLNSSNPYSVDIDGWQVYATYIPASEIVYLDSSTASPSAGVVLLSEHGNFGTSSASLKCDLMIYNKCTTTTGFVQTPIAGSFTHVLFDAQNPQTSTSQRAPYLYWGVSSLASSGAWSFTNVQVPYTPSASCSFPISYQCTHIDNNGNLILDVSRQGLDPALPNFTVDLIASPSATQNAPAVKNLDCGTDVWCNVIQNIQNALTSVFVPRPYFNNVNIATIQSTVSTHAPFAYISPLLAIATTDPSTSSAVPSFTFVSPWVNGTQLSGSVGSDMVSPLASVLTVLRGIFTFALYGLFIGYLFIFVKRVTAKI